MWEKVVLDTIYILLNQEKNFIVEARYNLSDWIEARVLVLLMIELIAKFLYKDVIYWYNCFPKLIYNNDLENKSVIKILADIYNIYIILISLYNLLVNGAIEVGY